ncbi:hypothetical protein [Devosia sp. FKR38]|uniref:hypothetical protein n=1 Tax=Devosia sp. FKR38 TaxID=2562312 RepID=UPI0010C08C22|nr:hypothetical protein [Devosia sp. FKR38]
MADYKELLRRAISALPENNGAARRAVYEKARSALVGQLRAITPPLPARDITQHRLQLEDCIRQVEQEASEAVIMLGREASLSPRPAEPRPAEPRPAFTPTPPPPSPEPRASEPKPVEPRPFESRPTESKPLEPRSFEPRKPEPVPVAAAEPVVAPPAPAAEGPKPTSAMSIEEIIEQAASAGGAKVATVDTPAKAAEPRVAPVVPRPEPVLPASNVRPLDIANRPTPFEPRRSASPLAPAASAEPLRVPPRIEPAAPRHIGSSMPAAAAVVPALSAIREVELEIVEPDTAEAEGAIERAIETLDREARGEPSVVLTAANTAEIDKGTAARVEDDDDSGFAAAGESRSISGLTIFLVVFAVLLVGVSGAGLWAWREGYIPVDQMFSQAQAVPAEAATTVTTPTLDPAPAETVATDSAATPGNTATATVTGPATTLEGLEPDTRLEPTPEPVVPTGNETVLPSIGSADGKGEERLPGQDATTVAANDPAASVDPAVLAGSQSLLLEASSTGTTGAVPFSGTVEWSEGVDELNLPTLIAHASIPARNLGVNITIRKNSDPSLPASHLMEVDFEVSDSFIGGTIANLPGVLLKNQELVAGTPLVGASARVVGNSFLFALSAAPDDAATNKDLLESRKWIDLAVVYGTGRNAIVTIEKDDDAQALFKKVFDTWAK